MLLTFTAEAAGEDEDADAPGATEALSAAFFVARLASLTATGLAEGSARARSARVRASSVEGGGSGASHSRLGYTFAENAFCSAMGGMRACEVAVARRGGTLVERESPGADIPRSVFFPYSICEGRKMRRR